MHIKEKTKRLPIRPRKGLLITAVLLLFLPDLNVIDLFPDVIAYILLYFVISPYSVIDDHMSDALRLIERMILIDGIQLASVWFIYGFLTVNIREQPMSILLCCFVFAFFKIKTVFPLCSHLSNGLIYLDTRHDGTMFCVKDFKSLKKKRPLTWTEENEQAKARPQTRAGRFFKALFAGRQHGNITEQMCRLCQIFCVAKVILNTLPEFSALYETGGYDETVFNWYDYVALFRGAAILISLIFGIRWLIFMLRYVRAVHLDGEYYRRLAECYLEEDRLHPERRTQKKLRISFLLITLAAVFTMDFTLDNINVMPDVLSAVFLLIALCALRPHLTSIKIPVFWISTYGCVSLVTSVVSSVFFLEYRPESILRSVKIQQAYIPVQILSVMEAVFMMIAMVCVGRVLFEIIERYTGYEIESTVNYSREEKLKEEHRTLRRSFIPVLIFGILTVLCGPLYIFLRPTTEFMWLFTFVVPAIFATLVCFKLMNLQDSVDSKYMLK